MSPITDKIEWQFADRDFSNDGQRAYALLIHARKMENALRSAVIELERLHNLEKTCQPVNHAMLFALQKTLQ